MKIPCENCIVLAICKPIVLEQDSIMPLTNKCSIIENFLYDESINVSLGGKHSKVVIYAIRKFFGLSEWGEY